MQWTVEAPRRLTLGLATATLFLVGCADEPVAPLDGAPEADAPGLAVLLTCAVDVRAETMECEPAAPSASVGGPTMNLIVGSQHRFVRLSNYSLQWTGDTWSTYVLLRNLTLQPFGTSDGVTPDSQGVRVFFVDEPSNGVEVLNHDGEAEFLESSTTAKYYQYSGTSLGPDEILWPDGASSWKLWRFAHNGATTFTFSVLIWTTVPDPSEYSAQLTQLSAGWAYSCGLDSRGHAYCWGSGSSGNLGLGPTPEVLHYLPRAVRMPAGVTFSWIDTGLWTTCADGDDASIYCWGSNTYGQVGDGTTDDRDAPVAVDAPVGIALSGVAVGQYHACALDGSGKAYCWGVGGSGQLGNGTTDSQVKPTPVSMPTGVAFTRLSAGASSTCADGDDGSVYCWGSNANGRLGDGTSTNQYVPVEVAAPTGVKLSHVTVGDAHACAQGDDDNVYCWGNNQYGQLGVDTVADHVNHPVPVAAPPTVALSMPAAADAHTCAIGSDGRIYCWGGNEYGQLGDGTEIDRPTPTAVAAPPGVRFESITAGSGHSCAISTTGDAYCWGRDGWGEVGRGRGLTGHQLTPRLVAATRGR